MSKDSSKKLIPSQFHSFETNKPFDKCIECEKFLLEDADYIIEKAMRRYDGFSAVDTVFDYAICVECAMNMRNEFSKESIQKVDDYFKEGMQNLNLSYNQKDPSTGLEKCAIKNDHISDLKEYQIYAYCKGQYLNESIRPYMVGGPAIDEILPLLSNPTIDFLNGFYDKHFTPDPSLMEPTPKLVFV